MNILDIVILILLVLGIWRGLRSGAIKQVSQVVGLVVAFALAIQLMDSAGLVISSTIGLSEQFAPLIGFVLVFLVVFGVVALIFKILERILKALMLGPVNKLLGGVAGAFKIALFLSIAFVVLGHVGIPGPDSRADSVLYGPVESIAPATWNVISRAIPQASELSDKVGERLNPGASDESRSRD